ncbi:hypothetical protein K466DRAFT_600363 [Polyporus arcularius HHB13444]|uniref:Uncharacterized protein n=1 Tax=Polyporus arcularius HHB13444 TaxID=1314778 RepID=A0A5C3PCU1_9APHY|nr:hypothetical protein K466DRAFT_600363 [Polyporus arcularius HHB13444]
MAGSLFQHSYFIVNVINAMLYGMALLLYCQTVTQILEIRKSERTSMDKFMMGFVTVLLVLNTIYWSTQAYFGEMMWITHADYPGGADAYVSAYSSVWYQTWGTTASVMSNLMSDALLTYRCFVIWNSKRIIVVPGIIWLASLAFGVGLLYESGRPNGDYFGGIAATFVTAYTASTFAFNVLVTSLICGRIIFVGRSMRAYGAADTKVYTGAVAVIVESALPFTIFSVAYLITFAMGSDVAYAFSFYAMFTFISPLMIASRVLSRRAWTRKSGMLFTTTISYRGQTDYVSDPEVPMEFLNKKSTELDMGRKSPSGIASTPTKAKSVAVDLEVFPA